MLAKLQLFNSAVCNILVLFPKENNPATDVSKQRLDKVWYSTLKTDGETVVIFVFLEYQ